MQKAGTILIIILALAQSALAQIPERVNGWPYISSNLGFAEHAVTRLAYDENEIHLFFNTMTGEVDKFHLDGQFCSGWPVLTDTLLFGATPVPLDIDHDGRYEVLAYGAKRLGVYQYSLLYLFDDDGSVMSGFPIRLQQPVSLNAVDLDMDNEYEIIIFAEDSDLLYCFDRFGNSKPGWPVSLHVPGSEQGYTPKAGAIGDFDLDGTNEYLISGMWGIYVFRSDGSMQPGFPILLQDTTYIFRNAWLPPILADIDLDGYLELINSGDNWSVSNPDCISFVAVYEHDGTPKEGWPIYFPGHMVDNAPTPSDINGDGQIEIGIQVGDSLYFLSLDQEILPGWPVALRRPDGGERSIYSDLITIDIDGDGDCEIFCDFNAWYADSMGHDSLWYYGHSYLFAMDHIGNVLPGYPILVRGLYLGRPPTFTLDNATHRLYMGLADEMMVEVDTVSLELFLFPDSTGPPTEWPMLSHDNLQTRNYNFVDRVTSIENDGDVILPKSPILKQNYPNPFNFSTMIEFSLPKEEHFTLSL